MILIIDTSIIITALLKESPVRKIILNPNFKFYVPDFLLYEVNKNMKSIRKRTGLTEIELKKVISLIFSNITVVPIKFYTSKWKDAEEIIGDIDRDDTPFFALALTIPNDGIWSNDPHFLKQNKIKIWKTTDLMKYL
jgi:predicted nucleic acid-binding protein